MKIKNILTTVGVAGVLGSTILTGCGTKEETTLSDTNVEEETISYDAFSQTISEIINVNRNEINQLDGHLGYQPVAISLESYGKYFGNIDNGCIYFVNNQDIVSKVNQFGTPVSSNVEVEGGEFLPYQHILLVPSNEVDSNFEKNTTYPYHDGYQVVGADTITYGQYFCDSDETYLLYTNTETVKCTNYSVEDGKIKSVEFGVPVEKNKVLEKEQ